MVAPARRPRGPEWLISEVVGNLVAVRLVVSKRCQGVSLTGGTLALHVLCSPPLRRWGRERLRGTAATDPCGSTLISSGFVNCDLIKSRVRGHAGGSRSRQPALASRGNTRTHGTKNPETEIHRNANRMAKVKSKHTWRIYAISRQVCEAAAYSASAEDMATILRYFEANDITPPNRYTMYP